MLSINYERAEAAVQSEAASAVEQLQQQLAQLSAERQEADSKLSAAGQALESATSEIEQLTAALQDAELLQQLRRQQELVVEHQQAAVEVRVTFLACLYCHGACVTVHRQMPDVRKRRTHCAQARFMYGPMLAVQA
jgi:multidrug efflux pump subunit AcrA (membrane-fusion protein)